MLVATNGQDEALVLTRAPAQKARPQTAAGKRRVPDWTAQKTQQWQVSERIPHPAISHRVESTHLQRR